MIVLCLNRMLTPVVLESEMISFITRSSGTAQLSALRQTVPSGIVPPALGYNTTEKILVENLTQTHTNFGAGKYLPEANGLWSSGPKVSRSLSGTYFHLL